MAESRAHLIASNRIAKKYGVEYNKGKGVDVRSKRATVEVETAGTVAEAPTQLKGHKGPVYIAGANQETIDKALEVTKGTTIGVMDSHGKVIKSSTRKR